MGDERDLTVATDLAWAAFRGRLADHVAVMDDGDVLVVEYADATAAPDVVAPYVQLCAFGDGWVRAEAAGNAYLDDTFALDDDQEVALLDLGWEAPGDEAANFHHEAPVREADRVAVLLVRTLREVHAVPHPAFLLADGLAEDPCSATVAEDAHQDGEARAGGSDGAVAFPEDRDHLQALVDEAMAEVFPDLQHDDDGDIPIVAGQSMAFVRVLPDRPGVEVHAEVAIDVEHLELLDLELGLLNRAHPMWKFVAVDDVVLMRYEVMALPFSAHLLRALVARFVGEVDDIARDLVARVGGRRFLDLVPGVEDDEPDEPDLAMTGLLELCHLGVPRAATVAGLFDGDQAAVVRQIVAIRTGQRDCDGHDVEVVLTVLRKALRHLADQRSRESAHVPVDDETTVDLDRSA